MKAIKKIAALLASGVLCATALVGCGGEDFYKGKWVPVEITEGDKTFNSDNAESEMGMKLEDFMTIEFKDDGKVDLNSGASGNAEGTWKMDGDNVIVEEGGESQTIKKDGDNIIMENDGVKIKLEKK